MITTTTALEITREFKQATLLNHGRKSKVNILHAMTVVSARFQTNRLYYSRTSIIRTSIIRTFRLSGLFDYPDFSIIRTFSLVPFFS